MSVTLMAAVWPLDIPTTDKMVLLALADAANDDGVTWIAVRSRKPGEKLDILRKCSLSERAVQGAIKRLQAAGLLKREETPGKGCTYTVTPQTPARNAPRTKCAPQQTTPTPAADAGKPSITINPQKASPSSGRARAKPAPKAQPFRMPDDWKPSRFTDGTVARAVVDRRGREWARAALESFRCWAANADDHVGLKRNWQAAWAKWVIEQDRRDGRNGHRQGNSGSIPGLGRTGSAAVLVFGADAGEDVEPDFEALRRVGPGGGERAASARH